MTVDQKSALCPFCGHGRLQASPFLNTADMKMWRVKCSNCSAAGPSMLDPEGAYTAWNKRPEIVYEPEAPAPMPEPVKIVKDPADPMIKPDSVWYLIRRHVEMHGFCSCLADLKCIHCRLKEALENHEAGKKGDSK